ncbi:hypothetical protein AC529_04845 [Thermobifida cellulosilytica TB100]|uniref:Uncharacterized protein n=1 Tax=Thermobifida cellulosilytica TB100 TaxID=665004 RepID=A0A147KKD7_THECS|nr:hypothetical protein AC529_04845 [Thermobifida cellulosilytica TB100]
MQADPVRQDVHTHPGTLHLHEVAELLVADRFGDLTQRRLVDDHGEAGRIRTGQDLFAQHPRLDVTLRRFLINVESGVHQQPRITVGLHHLGEGSQPEHADTGRPGLQISVKSRIAEHVTVAVPPPGLRGFAGVTQVGGARGGVGDVVHVEEGGHVHGAGTPNPAGLQPGDLRLRPGQGGCASLRLSGGLAGGESPGFTEVQESPGYSAAAQSGTDGHLSLSSMPGVWGGQNPTAAPERRGILCLSQARCLFCVRHEFVCRV